MKRMRAQVAAWTLVYRRRMGSQYVRTVPEPEAPVQFLAIRAGWTRVYFDIRERGAAGLGSSLVLMVILHDAYFYWTHRLLHHPAFFERFHRVHHLSTTPTP